MTTDLPFWAGMFSARFTKPYDFDADIWRQVFDRDLRDWSSDELCTVMAWMQSEGQDWNPKTARDLVVAVRTYRKAQRQANEPPTNATACGLCRGKGWMEHYQDLPDDLTPLQTLGAYSVAVPCVCAKGQAASELRYHDTSDSDLRGIEARTNTAKAQRQSVLQHEAARFWMSVPLPTWAKTLGFGGLAAHVANKLSDVPAGNIAGAPCPF